MSHDPMHLGREPLQLGSAPRCGGQDSLRTPLPIARGGRPGKMQDAWWSEGFGWTPGATQWQL
jgi:hypothetical protein